MKIILAVALLLLVTDTGCTWANFFHGGWPKQYEPTGPWFTPPGHLFNNRGHKHPPGNEENSSPCPLLKQLFSYKVNQLKNDVGKTCTAAWICRDPVTGDMIVTDADGREITINEHWQMNTRPNQNGAQNNDNYKCPNSNAGNVHNSGSNTGYPENINNGMEEAVMTPTRIPNTQPQTTETPRVFGGEGLIDVRIGID